MLKARDVEIIFKERGAERGALFCIQKICEDMAVHQQMLMECANAIDKLGDLAASAAIAAGVTADQNQTLRQKLYNMGGEDIDAPDYNFHDNLGDGMVPGSDKG